MTAQNPGFAVGSWGRLLAFLGTTIITLRPARLRARAGQRPFRP